ncbi:MAG TPA: GDP-mannose 4,6-dehydratase [Victivallales bacterium]|nr:GDP-mannose 4,6-dehydratase [Victivallales bacterium]
MQKDGKTILITGVNGFVGNALANYLHRTGHEITGCDIVDNPKNNICKKFHVCDIKNRQLLKALVMEVQPDSVYHMAGLIKSNDPDEFYKTNVLGTQNIFEAIKASGLHTKVLIPGSSAIYGRGYMLRPITEAFKPRAETPYGQSKVAQENIAFEYSRKYKIPTVIARTFNLVGPAQPTSLVCSRVANLISKIEKGKSSNPITTGNTKSIRDFIDIRDAIIAYDMLMNFGRSCQAYNVCSGKGRTVNECMQILASKARCPIEYLPQDSPPQANDVPFQQGSYYKLNRLCGWKPEISLEQSLEDMIKYWRQNT